jgi:uncharacterized repeat protein (TIGR03803 family)
VLFPWLAKRRHRQSKIPARHGSPARPRRRAAFRLCLETLEDRCLPSTLFVTNALDDGSTGSLRAEVNAAQAGDTIRFDPSLANAAIILRGVLPITTSLTIDGLGADQLTVGRATTDTNQFRVFDIGAGVNVTLYGLHVAGGFDPLGAGGGIRNAGNLTVNACWLDGNTSTGAAGAGGDGGGVFNLGSLAVRNSTFSGNRAAGGAGGASGGGGFGGALFNQGLVTLSNVTFSGNSAIGGPSTGTGGDGFGGAVYSSGGTVRVCNSTLAGNTSSGGLGGTPGSGFGGGLFNAAGGIVEVQNTIVATNVAAHGPDVDGAFDSDGNNLIGDGTGSTGFTSSGDQVGTSGSPLDPKFLSTTPQDNGGPTPTLGLAGNSTAVTAGNPGNAPASDQRGFVRVVGGKIDIGAFQTQSPPIAVTTLILTPSVASPAAGQFFAVTAAVAPLLPALTSSVPAGSVTFSIDGGSAIPGMSLGNLGPGQWVLTLPSGLTAGPHLILAGFTPSGDNTASSATLQLTVAPAPAPGPAGFLLHNFGNLPDGWQPWGSPTLVGSTLYGYTAYGGDAQSGAIFKVNTDGSGYQVVHSFGGLVVGPGDMVLADGDSPHHDSLRVVGNELIGATVFGGDANQGLLYAYNFVTGSYRIIHELNGMTKDYPQGSTTDGAQPHSNPMFSAADNVLYGLTSEGGSDGDGMLYRVNLDGTGFQVLRSFKKKDDKGFDPHGFVIQIGTVLFGMTREGGLTDTADPTIAPDGGGGVFAFDVSTSKYTVMHLFNPTPQTNPADNDGFGPDHGGLIAVGGSLYGLATMGGEFGKKGGDGILFQIQPVAEENAPYQILHDFSGTKDNLPAIDGSGPHGSLVLGSDGVTLFGMTSNGGSADDGIIFAFSTATNATFLLKSFLGAPNDGNDGLDNVVVTADHLYGLTKYGGSVVTNPFPTPPAPDYAPAGTPNANGTVFGLPLVNATTTTLTSNHNPSRHGQAVTFTATVQGTAPGSGAPPGSVTFRNGGRLLAKVALVNGQAQFTTAGFGFGAHTITATYSGFSVGPYRFTASSRSLRQVVQLFTKSGKAGVAVDASPGLGALTDERNGWWLARWFRSAGFQDEPPVRG